MSETMRFSLPESPLQRAATAILARLQQAGFAAAMVGGAVRDLLAERMPSDIDLVTTARPEQVAALFPDVRQVGAAFGVSLLRHGEFSFEIATARLERNYLDGRHPEQVLYTDDLACDVERRDFTVNALLCDPVRGVIIDHTGGLADFEAGILRTVGDPERRFREDYLRMLRAVRFAARLNFTLAPDTRAAIVRFGSWCAQLAAERVGDELTMMLTGRRPDRAVRLLHDTGLLRVLLPEVAALDGIEQPVHYHPEGDVLEHTIRMLEHTVTPTPELAWSVLLHDIGKPASLSRDEAGVPHFYNHEFCGMPIARTILKRLRFSNDRIERVTAAVGNHMLFGLAKREAKLRRLETNDDFALELELNRLDAISGEKISEQFLFWLDRRIRQAGTATLPPPLLTGRDLLAAGFQPGPRFKLWLDQLYEQQLEGTLPDRAAAWAWLQKQTE